MNLINYESATKIQREITSALNKIADENRVQIDLGRLKFDPRSMTGTFKVIALNSEGKAETTEAAMFKQAAKNFGLDPEDLGRTFFQKNVMYKIVGLKPSRPRYPLLIERVSDGVVLKSTASFAKNNLTARYAVAS